ncbi:Rpn family recombination-promoting nuclease/putative transposase, partial [Escherichia coli]|nr:Rpn family recombination-promoting nuclease/putative transposase [Escherichia coli]MDA7020247.1 Rpn family recombination-promoting nuclease/putative transposase [Escherichia coli]
AQRLPQHEDNIMTLAERIEQKGIAKGIERGLAQGIEQGKLEGKLETACNMLNAGMDRQTVLQMTGLSNDQLNMLKH